MVWLTSVALFKTHLLFQGGAAKYPFSVYEMILDIIPTEERISSSC